MPIPKEEDKNCIAIYDKNGKIQEIKKLEVINGTRMD